VGCGVWNGYGETKNSLNLKLFFVDSPNAAVSIQSSVHRAIYYIPTNFKCVA
jgi:hypothetical protein